MVLIRRSARLSFFVAALFRVSAGLARASECSARSGLDEEARAPERGQASRGYRRPSERPSIHGEPKGLDAGRQAVGVGSVLGAVVFFGLRGDPSTYI